ncbi:hypothetical protein B0T26DRAFT_657700 [Lasiosphaeria miniovina]|uniref:Uncharacterized protein n=1 Tax=Lasiosphaeria miniovina TaxID=1954250 RepID=A0AA40DIW8_9PEZI|nr:uncharacterized protein B0T26DRAFT_657700 [Lasiosphaeria miniovina]KAK0703011.1 hypothetical protein B0T26DRAFT_657700 [Lasiosphaeria miniovina]
MGQDAAVGWQASPDRRSTLTIIENSLFTIFACTWSIQHLNVPAPGETLWMTLSRKCKWAAFTVFFPEFLMAQAILEFVMAVDDMSLLNKIEWRQSLPWWYRAFRRISSNSSDEETAVGSESEVASGNHGQQWTLTHCYFANMGGFHLAGRSSEAGRSSGAEGFSEASSSPEATATYIFTAGHFADFWQTVEIPELSEKDLNDRSKTDYFTKALAAVQIAQLLLSLMVRTARHLAFSQLETLTLAFATCGVLTYICYWYKPQDVKRPIKVRLRRGEDALAVFQQQYFDRLWDVLTNSRTNDDSQSVGRIRNDTIPKAAPETTHYALYVLAILTAGFGSIHALAWNFEFPTRAEQIVWRAATLASSAVPPLALLAIPLSQILVPWGNPREFMHNCLRAMREYSWGVYHKEPVQAAMRRLEEAFDDIEKGKRHYGEIFMEEAEDDHSALLAQLLDFVHDEISRGNRLKLPDDFLAKLTQLASILGADAQSRWPDGEPRTKRLIEEARTNLYPQRVLFTRPVNLAIIYATSAMYCLARLSLIGVAFASLRRMPDSVYVTTWAADVPSLQ